MTFLRFVAAKDTVMLNLVANGLIVETGILASKCFRKCIAAQ
jgi:hypothetical protein